MGKCNSKDVGSYRVYLEEEGLFKDSQDKAIAFGVTLDRIEDRINNFTEHLKSRIIEPRDLCDKELATYDR